MVEHLNQQIIEDYRQRKLAAADLLIADEHLANCDECFQRIANLKRAESVLSSFAADSPALQFIETDHLNYEQIAGYVDGKLDDVDKEIADVHLAVCRICDEDVKALAAFEEEPLPAVKKQTAFSEWLSGLLAFPSGLFNQPAFQFASAALVLLFFGGLMWFFWERTRPTNQDYANTQEQAEKEIAQIQQPTPTTEANTNQANQTGSNTNEKLQFCLR